MTAIRITIERVHAERRHAEALKVLYLREAALEEGISEERTIRAMLADAAESFPDPISDHLSAID